MKRTKIYRPIFVVIAILFSACADNLDLEPEQSLTPEVATGTEANILNLLVGAYDFAGSNDLFSGNVQLASELLANEGELAWRGTFTSLGEFNRKQMTSNNVNVTNFWIDGYSAINQANLVLDNLNLITDAEVRNRAEGEAKFIKSLVYFELVRLYALPYEAGMQNTQPGVPLVNASVSELEEVEYPARSTVEEVYAQIITDLLTAYDRLPEDNGFYANKYAAMAVLARIYLQQQNYAAAVTAADVVINNSGNMLTPAYQDAFNNDQNSTEDIFGWQITTQDGINDFNTFWATRIYGGRSLTADVTVEQPYFDLFDDTNDLRGQFFYSGSGTLVTTKWQYQFGIIPFIRLAEMHLIRAESNMRMGTSTGASPADDISALRVRAGASAVSSVTIDYILTERKRELGFEGFALHDLKRLKGSTNGVPYNSNTLVLPLPQREIDANPNLTQNPGYTQ